MGNKLVRNARTLRETQTRSESLLWEILRSRQLCGLKFRRQHPIETRIADFACVQHKLIVELDGGYHEQTGDADLHRDRELEQMGWKTLRFAAEDVEADPESVAIAISKYLGLQYEFKKRGKEANGMYADPRSKGRSQKP